MKRPRVSTRNDCRACGGRNLRRCVHLPKMPFTDDFVRASALGTEFLEDIDIFVCEDCMMVQTRHDVDVADYYEDYQYSVGASGVASHFMGLLASRLRKRFFLDNTQRRVLEIGSGDGQQLLAFKELGWDVLGCEPSSALCRVAEGKGIPSFQGLFSKGTVPKLPSRFNNVDVVLLSYTFDHLPDPRDFLQTAKSILNEDDGLLVVEVHDLEQILDRCEYCLFEHEHTTYMTESTAAAFCRREGFEIVDFDLVPRVDRRANSLIFVATPATSKWASCAAPTRTPPAFGSIEFYENVEGRIRSAITRVDEYVNQTVEKGESLAGYGAGGRGVMTLAAISSSDKFRYLVDRKPKGEGLVTPKTGVPLVGLEALRREPIDNILVFSFGYMKEIVEEVGQLGYRPDQFISLVDILAGHF